MINNMTKQDIHKICWQYVITNYTIREDGLIDVDGNVYLGDNDLDELPLMFNKVSGNFDCNYNNLTSLVGCPKYVGGNFICSENALTSLEFCPEYVGGDFYCGHNYLTSFDGCPNKVGGGFYCNHNNLSDISYDPLFEAGIEDIYCGDIDEITAIRRQWFLNSLIND